MHVLETRLLCDFNLGSLRGSESIALPFTMCDAMDAAGMSRVVKAPQSNLSQRLITTPIYSPKPYELSSGFRHCVGSKD